MSNQPPSSSDEPVADQRLDLSGEVCPYTFVKSKLAIEALDTGNILQVIVDNAESASNVPRSIELEGHEVLLLSRSGNAVYNIFVRKK